MIVNLTPHEINILNESGEQVTAIATSGTEARCRINKSKVGSVGGVDLYQSVYGEVYDLPEPQTDIIYIVSGIVRAACPERTDLWQPGELVRDEYGKKHIIRTWRTLKQKNIHVRSAAVFFLLNGHHTTT